MKLKNFGITLGMAAAVLFTANHSAFAVGGMLKACKKELKEFNCNAKTEAAAHECLEQHDESSEHKE